MNNMEERLKETLQSKSHLFTVGKNNYQLIFVKTEDGDIKNIGFNCNDSLPRLKQPPCSLCGRDLCDCMSQFKSVDTLSKPSVPSEPIYYDCTLSKFAEQLDVPLWKAMEFGKYFKPSVPIEPYQPPKSNHLEVNYISVGFYKHEIDYGVLGSVQELSDTDFAKMLDMLKTAIRVAKEMRERHSSSNP